MESTTPSTVMEKVCTRRGCRQSAQSATFLLPLALPLNSHFGAGVPLKQIIH
jgi:hypothetical protein